MKKLIQTIAGCVSMLSAVAQTTFTPGNLVVLQTSGTLSKASSAVTLKEFTTSGVAGLSVALPATGPTPLQSAGVFGGSEGFLTTSADNKYLVLSGYATAGTYTDITATSASAVARAVGIVYPSGFYLQFDTSNTFFSANDIRGAVSDGTNFWAAGASAASVDGIDYFGPGNHVALATGATPPKAYGIRLFNGQIYYSTQKAGPSNTSSQLGIFALGTGTPTSGSVSVAQVINTAANTPEDFSFNATGDVCYVAINSNNAAGGIQKWTKSGSTWSLAYTLGTGIASTGAYGLVVDYTGAAPVIYATTADVAGNRVIKIVDNGTLGTAVITTLVSATSNVFYKGITFAPVASGTPLVNISLSTDTASEAGASVVTVTAKTSAPVVGDQTVTLAVTGAGITTGDYSLSNTTITIPSGTTSGSVTFTVTDDILGEGTEVAALTISAPSSGIALGLRPTQRITIADNDGNNHPTIVLDTTTTNFIDTGSVVELTSPLKLTGVISDPTDPANVNGLNFRVNDLETVATALTVWAGSSNTTVVPAGNIVVTGAGAIRNVKITPAAIGYSDITVKVTDGIDTTSFVVNYGASAAALVPSSTFWHTGMSDASDAIAQDDNYFMSGDDELNVLNVYSRSSSGMPVKSFNYTQFLSLPNPAQPEADIEAACVSPTFANRSYWMGSMSNGKSPFDNKPNRDRLFATTYSGTGANTTFTFSGWVAIKTSLLAWGDANGYGFTASAAAGVDSKAPNGFAAEGMVFGPDNTTMYIGMRAPLVPTATRTKAVIAPILNFETWFNNGAPSGSPTYGAPIELNLGGRGIRDIIRLSNGSYVIIAGSSGGDMTSAIYKWTGNATDAPIIVPSTVSGVLNMEGVMQMNQSGALSTTSLQIITDNGDDDFYNDGGEAKGFADLIFRKFRSEVITGLDLTYPEINIQGSGVTITDGSATPAITNNTDMGGIAYGYTTTRNFVVQNLGTAALNISSINFSGAAAGDFSLASAPTFPLSVAANGTYTLTVQFAPTAIGVRNATINIVNNDNDEATYDFAIRGTGLCDTPAVFAVSGGGTLCAGGTGFTVDLSSSSASAYYQLYNGASAVGSVVAGTGSSLSLGTHTVAGTYTVVAVSNATGCTSNMTGSATIVVNPLPTAYTVTGGGAYCAGGSGSVINLGNSTTGISYQLYNGATPAGSAVSGTGSAISFGSYTTAGSYSVVATNTTTTCANNMNGSATVSINPLPTAYTVTGGGSYCAGGTGTHIGLGGSSMGFNYQLFNGSTAVTTVAGTGSPLDFGLNTASGVYTVLATNTSTACVSTMPASAVVSITPVVTPSVTVSTASTAVCTGTTVTFSSSAINEGAAPVYQWRVNGMPVATTSGYSYVPVNGDIVSVKMTSNAACTTVDSAVTSVTMTVNPYVMPMATIAAMPGNILCEGSPVTFVPTVTNGGTAPVYTWLKNSAVVSSSPTYSCIPTNGDDIVLSLTSNKPCRLATTVFSNNVIMNIGLHYLPVINIAANPGLTVTQGTPVTLTTHVTAGGPNPTYQWVKNGTIIAGAVDSTYSSSTFHNHDSVSCIVTGTGTCGLQSNSSVRLTVDSVILLGVTQVSSLSDLTVMPNPNEGAFFIKGTTTEQELTITISNVLGQNVYMENITVADKVVNKRIVLNNELPAGLYLLSVHSNSGTKTFRVTVSR